MSNGSISACRDTDMGVLTDACLWILQAAKYDYRAFLRKRSKAYQTQTRCGGSRTCVCLQQGSCHTEDADPCFASVSRYADYATPDQRASLLLEFYGPKYALFKGKGKTKSLDQILNQHPDKKGKILEHLKSTLTPLLEKGLCAHNIVHRALYNYLRYIPSGAPEFLDMLESIKELLVEM